MLQVASMTTIASPKKRRGRPRASDVQQRSDDLLEVAEMALVELGYEGVTLNLIAERASVSKRTIYAKYGDKKGLLEAVLKRMSVGTFGPELSVEDDLTFLDGLRWRGERILRNNLRPGAIAITAIALRESKRFPEFLVTMLEAKRMYQQDPLRLYFERLRDRGIIWNVDCDALASMFLWMLSEDMINTVATGIPAVESDDVITAKAELVANMLTGTLFRLDRHASSTLG